MVPLWPNGEGIGLLSQGLWVQVPPGVGVFFATYVRKQYWYCVVVVLNVNCFFVVEHLHALKESNLLRG